MRFYAKNGQDRYLLESFFRGKRGGVFIEVGAGDGESASNSLFFEETMHWSGLCIEPAPAAFPTLRARRKAACVAAAVAPFEGLADYLECDPSSNGQRLSGLPCYFGPAHIEQVRGLTTGKRVLQVPALRLASLLEQHAFGDIDLCAIDAAGAEVAILDDLDVKRFRISVLTVRHAADEAALLDCATRKGYEFVARLGPDLIFKRHDVARLPRTTVICSVWHGDPDRWALLRGHQVNLRAQQVPVEMIYVFDGNDCAPEWCTGRSAAVREPLTIYQAWNVALSMVNTPFVMNLNLDDRLAPDAVKLLETALLQEGAAAAGGDWAICYDQAATDAVRPSYPCDERPFLPHWPPVAGSVTRLGSGTGHRGTFGPAVMWRMSAHMRAPRYPYRMEDGTLLRIVGDAAWWMFLAGTGQKLARVPRVLGNYHSHPGQQAEFRPGTVNELDLLQSDVQLSLL